MKMYTLQVGEVFTNQKAKELKEYLELKDDLIMDLWGIIANASGGDWDKETKVWKQAAERVRDRIKTKH